MSAIDPRRLVVTKADPAACQFLPSCTVLSAYRVWDQYGRDIGWLLRAKHRFAGGAPEWYAVTPEFSCSTAYLATRKEAEPVLVQIRDAEFVSVRSLARPMAPAVSS